MRDLRGERTRRSGVREERLRVTVSLAQPLSLSAWRGRSGRRYVVGVHPFTEADVLEVTEAVLIAVRREVDGTARVVDLAAAGPKAREAQRRTWMSLAEARGATEMHVHRLAPGEAERSAVIADLSEDA